MSEGSSPLERVQTEEERWTAIFFSHPVASQITPDSISKALAGFPLVPVRDLGWLARAIQPAVYLAADQRRPTKSTKDVRKELQKLAAETRALCTKLFDISDDAEDAIWRFARSLPGATDDSANEEMAYLAGTRDRLTGTMAFLERATADTRTRKPASQKWDRAADKNLRKWFAVWLSPAFEEGFGRRAVLSNADRTGRHEHGHWADFYERVMALAFQRPGVENLRKVLGSARSVTKLGRAADVVRFPPGWFPK